MTNLNLFYDKWQSIYSNQLNAKNDFDLEQIFFFANNDIKRLVHSEPINRHFWSAFPQRHRRKSKSRSTKLNFGRNDVQIVFLFIAFFDSFRIGSNLKRHNG